MKIKPKILIWEWARKIPGAKGTRISFTLLMIRAVPNVTPAARNKKPAKIKFLVMLLIISTFLS
jgi:hypothetical protein